MKDAREAPTNDPTTGKLADAAFAGAGAGASWAITALMEAAAKRIAQATFIKETRNKKKEKKGTSNPIKGTL